VDLKTYEQLAVKVDEANLSKALRFVTDPHRHFPSNRFTLSFNPLTPTVSIWVQLWSILCQTGLSRHL